MDSLILLAVALVPAIALLVFVFKKDRVEKEPIGLLLLLLFGGVLAALATLRTGFIPDAVDKFFLPDPTDPDSALLMSFIGRNIYWLVFYTVGVGAVEEGFKWIFMHLFTHNSKHFNSLFDGLIYAVFCSLGFAGFENILYTFNNGISVGLMRAVTSIPAHMFFAVFMGYYYSLAHVYKKAGKQESILCAQGVIKLKGKPLSDRKFLAMSYFVPVIVHGLYDFSCSTDMPGSILIFIGFLIGLYVYCFRKINKMSKADANSVNVAATIVVKKYPELAQLIDNVAEQFAMPGDVDFSDSVDSTPETVPEYQKTTIDKKESAALVKKSYTWTNGTKYTGFWLANQMHGQGTLTYPNGACYVGNFRNGHFDGYGEFNFVDGSMYKGYWKNGKYDGEGTFIWPNGKKRIGKWSQGKFIG